MPEKYDDSRPPGKGSGWRRLRSFKLPDRQKVNIWIDVVRFGMSDAWEVPEAWRRGGKWFHVHNGREMEIRDDIITHWRPVREVTASPPERLPDNGRASNEP